MELLLSLLLASFIQAPHPCDVTVTTSATKGDKVGWCHDLKDNNDLSDPSIGFKLYINTTLTNLGSIPPIGPPSISGMYYFEVALPNGYSRGIYQVYLIAFNAEGDSSPSEVVGWQIGGPPNQPKKPRIP